MTYRRQVGQFRDGKVDRRINLRVGIRNLLETKPFSGNVLFIGVGGGTVEKSMRWMCDVTGRGEAREIFPQNYNIYELSQGFRVLQPDTRTA